MTQNKMDQQAAQTNNKPAAENKASISSRISKYGKYDRLEG